MRKAGLANFIVSVLSLLVIAQTGCSEVATPTSSPPVPLETETPSLTVTPSNTASPSTTSPDPTSTPTPVPHVRFAVIGDYGQSGPGLAAVADLINSWQVDLILTTGDNNYTLGSPATIDENIGQYFHSYIYPYQGTYGEGAGQNRFFPSLGNHDWLWLDAQPYLEYFELPGNERYYSFSWEFVDFFALSSDWEEPDGITPQSTQGSWLQKALSDSTGVWQIVYFHHAPYSSGYHGPTEHMRWPFQDWGVDTVFSGHDHHYERLVVNDLLYFVQGLSGGAMYDIYQIDPRSQVRYNQEYGALLVDATPTLIWFGFYNIDGELVDEYTLTK